MGSSDWTELVAETTRIGGEQPVDRWAVGDMAVQAVPPGHDRQSRQEAARQLERFAQDSGLALALLKDCHRTSAAWPAGERFVGISHARHSTFANRPNRVALLLGDEIDDGLSVAVRRSVEKAEELLSDAKVRQGVISRSKARTRLIASAARTMEEEKAQAAKVRARVVEEQAKAELAAAGMLTSTAEMAIRANVLLAKTVAQLVELQMHIKQFPENYQDRTRRNLEQVAQAAQQSLDTLRPVTRSPQLHDVITIEVDDIHEAEHR